MADKVVRDYYKVLLISQSGKGKTYSFRNFDRKTTGFINAENKPLPFEGAFKHYIKTTRFQGVLNAMKDLNEDPEVSVIVLDGFNMALDMLLEEMRNNFKGYDVWSNYNIQVSKLLNAIKGASKEVFVTGHYEILNQEGDSEKRLKVHGKEHEGRIEAHFTIVAYADSKYENDKPKYFFRFTGEGLSAKCPPEILGKDVHMIENDSKILLDKVVEFALKSSQVEEDIFV
jgi:hypothetical protein